MEESATEPQNAPDTQEDKKHKVSSILRPGSMGKYNWTSRAVSLPPSYLNLNLKISCPHNNKIN